MRKHRGDYATALQLFVTLARKGNAAAQTQIGWMYEWGFGVSKDSNEAIKWYRLAAAQGNLEAQRLLGFVYGTGRGVPEDDKEALKWFQLAATQGDATAQNKLGELYTKGGDVPRDYGEAVKWFRLAAGQGHEDAQNNLGLMYQRGQGVPQDYILSFMWLIIGKTNLASVVPTYSARPTPAQFALAQKLAKQCIVSNYKQCGEPQGGQSSVPTAATRWADPGALRAFVGKYAFDQINGLKLIEVPEVRSRIQMLLGANVPNLINDWSVSSPSEEHAGWLVAAGCRPHAVTTIDGWSRLILQTTTCLFVLRRKIRLPDMARQGKRSSK
jgi:Sel1 repeat